MSTESHNHSPDRPDWHAVDRYIAGEGEPAEWEAMAKRLASHADEAALLNEFVDRVTGPEAPPVDPAKRWSALAAELRIGTDSNTGIAHPARHIAQRRAGIRVTSWIGAAVLLIAGIYAFNGMPAVSSVKQSRIYTTSAAQRANITLSDGSNVTLAPSTTLRVTGREIELNGEALFIVSHKNETPFTVKTGNTVTKVLGTMFSVRRYADDEQVRVAVAEGKVSVNDVVLTNGDIALSGNKVDVQHDAERVLSILSFAQGRLAIDDETLAHAAPQIGRWLDLEIHFDRESGARRLSTVLHQETPSQALEDISRLVRAKYVRKGRVVTFTAD